METQKTKKNKKKKNKAIKSVIAHPLAAEVQAIENKKLEVIKTGHTVSQEQIDAWKAEHGEVFRIAVDEHTAYLKKPGRKAIGYASSIGTKDPMKFNEIILKACWLAGDEKLQSDDDLFLACGSKLADLIVIKQATLEKL
ncbi:hypothetical protein FNO01nite_30510 [Flavobacterium noncentrifugens]|uniref:Uncharacterized protein n=1 Tax=Flavobacterium noncentrifugens TaxID=1128970 RepID=A0A1G9BUY6_9FLAO|nr:hypothetical protein [Flavobacterium noncentrifugens]GEP52379.1 hypothetical protein FNO01nite_30510 [Flavobacterium noncentrifugens]SDK43288.1 hypothetical protein SAMN04487935_3364 [Flavobacterium noncentrifugens]